MVGSRSCMEACGGRLRTVVPVAAACLDCVVEDHFPVLYKPQLIWEARRKAASLHCRDSVCCLLVGEA